MKKTISIMLCLLLIFSSVSFAFAVDWSTTDSSNLQSIKNTLTNTTGSTIYYMISQINAAMRFSNKTIANWLSDIENQLATALYQLDGNNSRPIAWWVKEAVLDLDQLVGNGSGTILNYLDSIYTKINTISSNVSNTYTDVHSVKTNIADMMDNYLPAIRNAVTLYLPSIKTDTDSIYTVISSSIGPNNFPIWGYDNTSFNLGVYSWSNSGNPLVYTSNALRMINYNTFWGFQKLIYNSLNGYANTQTAKNWLTLQNNTFTPTSQTNGLYSWLANIQEPIARLAYVHASDEEIAAREKAAANQDAVVDNFIDSTGSGAAPASSFGSVASMSSGYTSNMNTDAQASGIWNIFNSNNFGWFSQETANQLDTTTASTRKGFSEFETPLLNQQIEEIYKELGVDVND